MPLGKSSKAMGQGREISMWGRRKGLRGLDLALLESTNPSNTEVYHKGVC